MDPILQDLFSLNTTEPAVVCAISDRLEELGRTRELGILRSGKPWWWQNGKVRYDRLRFYLMQHTLSLPTHPTHGYVVYVARQSWSHEFLLALEANRHQTDPFFSRFRSCSQKRAVQCGWRYYRQDRRDRLPWIRSYFYLGIRFDEYCTVYTTLRNVLAMCEVACHRLAFPGPIS